MKVLLFSSLPKDSGCWLRTKYLSKSLSKQCGVELVPPLAKCLPWMLDVLFSTPYYLIKALFTDADLLVGVKPFPNVTLSLLAAKWLRRKKIVVDIDDADYLYFPGFRSKIIEWVQKLLPRFFDLVTYHNPNLKELITQKFGVNQRKLTPLAQGVDLSLFYPRTSAPAKGGLFYMGHLNIASDLMLILKAVKIVQEKTDAPLVAAGGGPQEDLFREQAKKMGIVADFTGHLPADRVAELCSKAEICLVYYRENQANAYRCSMKLRECLAMGKKVVCNDFGDLKQFKEFTYQTSSDINGFAHKILEVLDKGDGREKKGSDHIQNHYDWDKIGEHFFNKLKELLDS